MKDLRDFSLKDHNTFGIDAKCRRFIEFESVEELTEVIKRLRDEDKPFLILGGGSNLLLTRDFNGTVLHSAIKGQDAVRQDDGILLRCGSGEKWDDVVSLCVDNHWYGAENLSLIPGDVGASAVQNIGAYGAEAKDIIYKVEAIELSSGKPYVFSKEDCGYSYRQSRFKQDWHNCFIITHVTYRLSREFQPRLEYGNILSELKSKGIDHPDARQLRDVIIDIRRAKLPDPEVEGNAGSFFMNPVVTREKYEEIASRYAVVPHYVVDADHIKIPAGWMIDRCGWKGKALGRAAVHPLQALVLVNRGGATGNDIVRLCNSIRNDVKSTFGIDLKPEVNII